MTGSDPLIFTMISHWSPSLLTCTFCHSVPDMDGGFSSRAGETMRRFFATTRPGAEQLAEILKQSDRSNYHLPTSSAPTLMKSTTLHLTSFALKLTFTSANNWVCSYLEYLLRARLRIERKGFAMRPDLWKEETIIIPMLAAVTEQMAPTLYLSPSPCLFSFPFFSFCPPHIL